MPDVWTTNPEALRSYLQESGSICGVAGRVLAGRDPAWTCTFDSKGTIRDVYIHPAQDLIFSSAAIAPFVLGCGSSILLGLVWGRRFWRRRS